MTEKNMLELEPAPQKGKEQKAITPKVAPSDLASMAEQIGVPFSVEHYIETLKRYKVKTYQGEISRFEYAYLILAVLQEMRMGAIDHQIAMSIAADNAARVRKGKGKPLSKEEIIKRVNYVMLKLAEMKVKYGLEPMTDVIGMAEGTQIYVTEQGFRKYAFQSGELEDLQIGAPKFVDIEAKRRSEVIRGKRCIVKVTAKRKGLPAMDFVGTASDVIGEPDYTYIDIAKQARVRAVRTALKFLFPLGISEEDKEGIEEAFADRVKDVDVGTNEAVEVRKVLTGNDVDEG